MISNQDSGGFLPPITTLFTNKHHHKSHSSSTTPTTTNPNHLPRYITLPLPQPSPTTPQTTIQESELAAAIDRALANIRNAVAAATRPTTVKNPIRRTKSDITYKTRPTRKRKIYSSLSSRKNGPECIDREDSPQTKRLKKAEEMVTRIKQRCKDVRCESEVKQNVEVQENVRDDNQFQAIVEPDEGGEESVGFKLLDEDEEECIGFKRLDDGALRIKMRCSCRKHFEILHNDIGCFYRLI